MINRGLILFALMLLAVTVGSVVGVIGVSIIVGGAFMGNSALSLTGVVLTLAASIVFILSYIWFTDAA